MAAGSTIIYVTGRPRRYRRDTARLARAERAARGELHMRPNHDRRPARFYKAEIIQTISRAHELVAVVDDDDKVVDHLREAGPACAARDVDAHTGRRAATRFAGTGAGSPKAEPDPARHAAGLCAERADPHVDLMLHLPDDLVPGRPSLSRSRSNSSCSERIISAAVLVRPSGGVQPLHVSNWPKRAPARCWARARSGPSTDAGSGASLRSDSCSISSSRLSAARARAKWTRRSSGPRHRPSADVPPGPARRCSVPAARR